MALATASALSSKTFVGSNCSADYNQGSFLVDYTVNKHFDIYGGVTFADQTGGFNSGSLAENSVTLEDRRWPTRNSSSS